MLNRIQMKKNYKKQQDGFIETIVLIVIALLLMRYFNITFTSIYYWVRDLILSVA